VETYRFFPIALAVLSRTAFAETIGFDRLGGLYRVRCSGLGEADARLIIGELEAAMSTPNATFVVSLVAFVIVVYRPLFFLTNRRPMPPVSSSFMNRIPAFSNAP